MSKELTDKWVCEDLETNKDYYVLLKNGHIIVDNWTEKSDWETGEKWCVFNWQDKVKEVLAPVPSFSEYQALKDNCEFTHTRLKGAHQKITQLEKRLEIATKALKRYSKDDYYSEGGGRSVNPYPHIARKALKEMEGVK